MALHTNSSPGLTAGVLAVIGSALLQAPLAAQEPSAIQSRISKNLGTWGTSLDAQPGDYLAVEIDADPAESGGWCGMIVDVYKADDTGGPLARVETTLETLLEPRIDPYGAYEYSGIVLVAHSDVGFDVLDRALYTASGSPTNSAVIGRFDPIWSGPDGRLVQRLVARPHDEWPASTGDGGYNLDAMLQHAVWQRIGSTLAGVDKGDYFESDQWDILLNSNQLRMTIRILLTRGPDIDPGTGVLPGGEAPLLDGWEENGGNVPLKFKASPQDNEITFIGSQNGTITLGGLRFSVPWMNYTPIVVASPGGGVVASATGFRRDMQAAMIDGTTRYEVDCLWFDYGVIAFRVPAVAPAGNYVVKEFRYADSTSGPGSPTYHPWEVIPAGSRLVVAVQNP